MTDSYFVVLTAVNIFVLAYMFRMVTLCENLSPRQASGFSLSFILTEEKEIAAYPSDRFLWECRAVGT